MPQLGVKARTSSGGSLRSIVKDGLELWIQSGNLPQTVVGSSNKRLGDSSSNSNNAYLYSGKALEFDGVLDYITTGFDISSSAHNTPNIDHTIAIWMKWGAAQQGSIVAVFSGRKSAGSGNVGTGIQTTSDDKIQFCVQSGNSAACVTSGAITFDSWHRVVGVCNRATQTIKIYVDGSHESTTSSVLAANESSYNGHKMAISSFYNDGNYSDGLFEGQLCDAQIWNVVWTDEDVKYDFQNPERLIHESGLNSFASSNLKLWYPMSEGELATPQTSIYDGSGDQNHGTTVFYDPTEKINDAKNRDFSADSDWTNVGLYKLDHAENEKCVSDGGGGHGTGDGMYYWTTFENQGNAINNYWTSQNSTLTWYSSTTPSYNRGMKVALTSAGSEGLAVASNSITLDSSKTYRIRARIEQLGQGTAYIRITNSSNGSQGSDYAETSTTLTGTIEVARFTPTSTGTYYVACVVSPTAGDNAVFDDVSLRESDFLMLRADATGQYAELNTSKVNNGGALEDGSTYEFGYDANVLSNTWTVRGSGGSNFTSGTLSEGASQKTQFKAGSTGNVQLACTGITDIVNDGMSADNTSDWSQSGSSSSFTFDNTEGAYQFVADNGNGMMQWKSLTRDRWYKCTFDLKNGTTSGTIKAYLYHSLYIQIPTSHSNEAHPFGDELWQEPSSGTESGTSYTTHTAYFRCGKTGNWRVGVQASSNITGYVYIKNFRFYEYPQLEIDNLSLKKVGISQGWTNADGQQDIPQTALMGGSKKALFDGVDDEIVIADSSDFDITDNLSVSVWAKNNSSSLSSEQGLMSKYTASGTLMEWMVEVTGDGKPMMTVSADGSTVGTATGGVVVADEWNHYVFTFASGTYTIYVNGVSQSITETGTETSIHNSTADVKIGVHTSKYWDGLIDECSIWKTAVLSSSEVQELYNNGNPLDAIKHSKSANLVGYWRNRGVGTWTDDSTNSNNGTVNGSPSTIYFPRSSQSMRDSQGMVMTNSRSNEGLIFDGVADYADVESDSSIEPTSEITVECWFRLDDTSSTQAMIGKDSDMLLHFAGNKLEFGRIGIGIGTQKAMHTWTADTKWHYISGTFDSNDSYYRLYLDGSLVATSSSTSTIPTWTSSSWRLGEYEPNGYFLKGEIDEARIYDKALQQADITKNYNAQKARYK